MSKRHFAITATSILIGCCLFVCFVSHTHAQTAGQSQTQTRSSQWGTLHQAHKLVVEEFSGSDAVLLYGVYPALIAGNAVLLTGNIVALARRKQTRTWGGIGLVVGILTVLGGVPLLADDGIAWTMLPLGGGATLIALSIANLALGDRPTPTIVPGTPTQKTTHMPPSQKLAQSALPPRSTLGRW